MPERERDDVRAAVLLALGAVDHPGQPRTDERAALLDRWDRSSQHVVDGPQRRRLGAERAEQRGTVADEAQVGYLVRQDLPVQQEVAVVVEQAFLYRRRQKGTLCTNPVAQTTTSAGSPVPSSSSAPGRQAFSLRGGDGLPPPHRDRAGLDLLVEALGGEADRVTHDPLERSLRTRAARGARSALRAGRCPSHPRQDPRRSGRQPARLRGGRRPDHVSAESGIETPADLVGKRVGMAEYQLTANVWIRGILAEHHGVPVDSVTYRAGGLHEPGRIKKLVVDVPDGVEVKPIGHGETLSDLLAAGEIDALYTPREPASFTARDGRVRRLSNPTKSPKRTFRRPPPCGTCSPDCSTG